MEGAIARHARWPRQAGRTWGVPTWLHAAAEGALAPTAAVAAAAAVWGVQKVDVALAEETAQQPLGLAVDVAVADT